MTSAAVKVTALRFSGSVCEVPNGELRCRASEVLPGLGFDWNVNWRRFELASWAPE
jgi:hypothetical protein